VLARALEEKTNATTAQQSEVQERSDLVNTDGRPNPEQSVLFADTLAVAALRTHGLERGTCVW